jgi:hypothetical protein
MNPVLSWLCPPSDSNAAFAQPRLMQGNSAEHNTNPVTAELEVLVGNCLSAQTFVAPVQGIAILLNPCRYQCGCNQVCSTPSRGLRGRDGRGGAGGSLKPAFGSSRGGSGLLNQGEIEPECTSRKHESAVGGRRPARPASLKPQPDLNGRSSRLV